MSVELQAYKALRIYRRLPTSLIFNSLLCNRIMKVPLFVNNASKIYKGIRSIFGLSLANALINHTFCKMLTAGNTIEYADKLSNYFRLEKIAVILDYCAEGEVYSKYSYDNLDANAAMFARSADKLRGNKNYMISIKITALVDILLLKQLNKVVYQRNIFWEQHSNNGQITATKLYQSLKSYFPTLTQYQLDSYIQIIHNNEQIIDYITFKSNHQPYYLYDQHKNTNTIISMLFPITKYYYLKMINLRYRLDLICDNHCNNNDKFKILVDAEQSYVQRAIYCFAEQLQAHYNKYQLFIIPTIQNYLKISYERTKYYIAIAKKRNLIFGAKLVRGAYMVEYSRLAKYHSYANPVVDCFDKTTVNYLNNFERMASSFTTGYIIIATHNKDTIYTVLKIKSKYPISPKISFAQLYGLADHLTWYLNKNSYLVYKYLPWANTDVMIAYMIRRAEYLNQMKYPLDMQYSLLIDYLKQRIRRNRVEG